MKTLKWIAAQSKSHIPAVIAVILLGSALSLCSVGIAVISKNLIDAATVSKGHRIAETILVFILLILAMIGMQAGSSTLSTRTLEALSNHMRQKLFRNLAKTEWQELSRFHSGDVLTRMTSDVGTVAGGIVNVMPGMISLGVRLISAFSTLMVFDRSLAFLAFVLGPVSILISRFFAGKLKSLYKKIQEAESTYRSFMQECLQNILVVKAFKLEDSYVRQISNLQNERLRWVMRRNRLSVLNNSVLSLGYWAGYFLAFCWGALRLSAGTATFGVLTAFFQLVNQVQSPFIGLAYTFPQLISTVASAERLMILDSLQREMIAAPSPQWTSAGVSFDQVSFAYEQEKPVLLNASFDICPGEIAAIVGPSGEGKTTVVRLLLSLIKPDAGKIRFFNRLQEEHGADPSSRSLISYVPQGNTLF